MAYRHDAVKERKRRDQLEDQTAGSHRDAALYEAYQGKLSNIHSQTYTDALESLLCAWAMPMGLQWQVSREKVLMCHYYATRNMERSWTFRAIKILRRFGSRWLVRHMALESQDLDELDRQSEECGKVMDKVSHLAAATRQASSSDSERFCRYGKGREIARRC